MITFCFLHAWIASWLSITSLAHQHFFLQYSVVYFFIASWLFCIAKEQLEASQIWFLLVTCVFWRFSLVRWFCLFCKSNILSLGFFFNISLQALFNLRVIFDNYVHIYLIPKSCGLLLPPDCLWNFSYSLCYPPRSSNCYLSLGLSLHLRASDWFLYKPSHSSQRNCFLPQIQILFTPRICLNCPHSFR